MAPNLKVSLNCFGTNALFTSKVLGTCGWAQPLGTVLACSLFVNHEARPTRISPSGFSPGPHPRERVLGGPSPNLQHPRLAHSAQLISSNGF